MIAQFVAAKAEGNYVQLFLNSENGIKSHLKRMTIKELEIQLREFDHIVKTHRSYLVNVSCIQKLSGNAQGYKLKIIGMSTTIPVSRKMIPAFEDQLKQISSLPFTTNS